MSRQFLSVGLFACVLLFSGCDAVNTAINDALPEINVGDGVLGLNGEAGIEVTGDFAASKTGGVDAIALFSINETFDDLETGDITTLTSLSTTLILSAGAAGELITIHRGTAASLPDQILITGGQIEVSLTDGSAPDYAFTPIELPNLFGALTREAGCASDASSCGYLASDLVSYHLGGIVLAGGQANQVLEIIRESTPPTPNTLVLNLALLVNNNDLAGTSATLRIGEVDTTVQAEIF